VTASDAQIQFDLDKRQAIRDSFRDPVNIRINEEPRRYIVEYSSPNIAKPFHIGHLRSTIIGNFLANLLAGTNSEVTRMNYLGDYGTQFGFLKAGIEMEKLTEEDIRNNPIESFFKAYVTANSSDDPSIAERARKVFEKMENGDEELQQWESIRQYSLKALEIMYERLNVKFDVYDFESNYSKTAIAQVLDELRSKNILHTEADGKVIVQVGNRRVAFLKSDGTTLYLTRDIAAFLQRQAQYKSDKTFYVVENGQNDHFTAIRSVLTQIGHDGERCVHHVKFGRIKGMSTRKGSVVFLKDVLDEARDLMFEKQKESASKFQALIEEL